MLHNILVSIPDLYSRGLELKSVRKLAYYNWNTSMVFLRPFRKVAGQYIQTSNNYISSINNNK
jgi:hypothetical protein